jgi:putative transposon-encoded protein
MLILFDYCPINDRRLASTRPGMMSPTFSPEKSALIPKEIVAIREEISLIEQHRTEHMEGLKVRQADNSCKYCQQHLQPKEQPIAESQHAVVRAQISTVNDLERTVEVAGKKGQITVPRSWLGKRVRVTLI